MLFSILYIPVTISHPIPPYMEVYRGIKDVLREAEISEDGVIAIGSDALKKLSSYKDTIFYSLVLYPERFFNKKEIHGVSFEPSPDIVVKEIEHRIGRKKVLILQTKSSKRYGMELLLSMKREGLSVDTLMFRGSNLASLLEKEEFDVLFILPDPETITIFHLQWLSLYCIKNGKILIGLSGRIIKAGGYMEITPRYRDVGRLTGIIYRRWMRGDSERIKKVYRPEKVDVRVNKRIKKLLGLNNVP